MFALGIFLISWLHCLFFFNQQKKRQSRGDSNLSPRINLSPNFLSAIKKRRWKLFYRCRLSAPGKYVSIVVNEVRFVAVMYCCNIKTKWKKN